MDSVFRLRNFSFIFVAFLALAQFLLIEPAQAERTDVVAPLKTISVPTGSDYTEFIITNEGPDQGCITVKGRGIDETFCLEKGESKKIVKIFNRKKVTFTNKSSTSTFRIDTKWL